MQVPEIKKYGGEGGIRTLGTGISQYSGLANLSFFGAAQLSQRLTRGRDVPKLGEDALIRQFLFSTLFSTLGNPDLPR